MLFSLDERRPGEPFPDPSLAEKDPDGLLAVGGDLTPERIVQAYRQGIFPWYGDDQPILWWSPDPRMVLFPDDLHVSRSLAKELRRGRFQVTFDLAFDQVIESCAQPRKDEPGTWLMPEMIAAYQELHRLGIAHSVETWHDGELVGGLYGNALGSVFFGESMFSRMSNASKVAFVCLVRSLSRTGYSLVDCQIFTPHLQSLGAGLIPRERFLSLLNDSVNDLRRFPLEVSCA
ncbi:leucyl/phenylalanyl-tRNA--protein transferase [Thiolapillus sp.]|uniref:leucyl/phenylalanyl-tRNA--protein transferase n=1 Tax=Thiolapillus sp. TaxID=2017437 RepID=UPI0025E49467|nr:leucyl/phenylalanyl-tRNA--protein transferase [Thiolapillus sp.]